jgi:DNA processing protein
MLARSPATISIRGGSLDAKVTVAVVGSRRAHPDAAAFARSLGASLASAGAVVVSGGALGIDAAAHAGALEAGGRTWCVAGTGCDECFPYEHASLYARIGDGPGAMIWPFAPAAPARAGSFIARNRVLVALSDAVVVVQAGLHSGALHAAACARRQERPLWVVPTAPWLGSRFDGSRSLLAQGARSLHDVDTFFQELGLGRSARRSSPPTRSLSPSEDAVLHVVSSVPLHLDSIAVRAGSTAQVAGAALLTLALENVVVEGPPGFFRRNDATND